MSERKPPKSWFWFKAAILCAFTVYPLTFGPASWLVGMGWLPPTLAGVVYYPIAGLMVFGMTVAPRAFFAMLAISHTAEIGFTELCVSVGLFQRG